MMIDVWTRGRFGYTLLEVSTQKNHSTYLVSGNSYGHWIQLLTSNFTESLTNMTVLSEKFIVDTQLVGNVANDIHFVLQFPIDLLKNTTNIRIGYSYELGRYPLWFDEELVSSARNDTAISSFIQLMLYRYEHIHYGSLFIPLFIIFVFLGLWILLSRHQPLRSRGISPLLACIIAMFPHTRIYFMLVPLTKIVNTLDCVWDGLLVHASTISSLLLVLFVFVRYVTLASLNQRKEAIIEQNIKYNLTLLKVIGSWYMNIIVMVFGWLFWYLIILIIQVGFLFQCNVLHTQVQLYLYLVIVIIIALGFPLVFCFDLYLNWQHIKKCDFLYFWKQDIFWIRFEIYILGSCIGIPVLITNNLVTLISPNTLLKAIWVSMIYNWYFVFLVIFPSIMTLFNVIRKCFEQRHEPGGLQKVLLHPRGYQLMYNHCKLEYSLENISCWKDIQDFKHAPTRETAEDIVKLYLNRARSDLEVNISSNTVADVQKKIKLGDVDSTLFDEVLREVLSNLGDTFSRLSFTSEWKVFHQIEFATQSVY